MYSLLNKLDSVQEGIFRGILREVSVRQKHRHIQCELLGKSEIFCVQIFSSIPKLCRCSRPQ